ncbi:hypothetical protein Thena_0415 [Thermodesulfobium narugense DSM 14796]|uniref:Uncharacterized protein n=1 Tax=Thermodesulfobium narugense DSM 14796 TaxID=747365 RepID=M1E696_9BACT|nr:hypothetical protein [Thermodesulfobium narugense]AEE14058.1 hypothetical protein Thena_0415 [Thermodesulfobium narugense DSM 14796]
MDKLLITFLIFILLSLNNISYADINNLEINKNKVNISAEDDFMSYTIGDSYIQAGHYTRSAQGLSFREKEKGFEYFTGRVYEYPEEEKRTLFTKPKAKYLTRYYYAIADNSEEDGIHYFYIDSTDKERKRENVIFGTRYVTGELQTSLGTEFDKRTKAITGSSIYNKFEHKRFKLESYFSTVNSEITQKKTMLISQSVFFKTIKSDIYANFNKGYPTYQLSSYKKIFDFNIRHTIVKSNKLYSNFMLDRYFDIADFNNSFSLAYQTTGNSTISVTIEKDLEDDKGNNTTVSFYTNITRQNRHIEPNIYLSINDDRKLLGISYEEKSFTVKAGVRIFKISGQSGFLTANIQNNKIFLGVTI